MGPSRWSSARRRPRSGVDRVAAPLSRPARAWQQRADPPDGRSGRDLVEEADFARRRHALRPRMCRIRGCESRPRGPAPSGCASPRGPPPSSSPGSWPSPSAGSCSACRRSAWTGRSWPRAHESPDELNPVATSATRRVNGGPCLSVPGTLEFDAPGRIAVASTGRRGTKRRPGDRSPRSGGEVRRGRATVQAAMMRAYAATVIDLRGHVRAPSVRQRGRAHGPDTASAAAVPHDWKVGDDVVDGRPRGLSTSTHRHAPAEGAPAPRREDPLGASSPSCSARRWRQTRTSLGRRPHWPGCRDRCGRSSTSTTRRRFAISPPWSGSGAPRAPRLWQLPSGRASPSGAVTLGSERRRAH